MYCINLYWGELVFEITENAHVVCSNNENLLYFISFALEQKTAELNLIFSDVSELHIASQVKFISP